MSELWTASDKGMKKAECIFDVFLGVSYLISTVIGYAPAFPMGEFMHLGEWCCITGIAGSLFYFGSFFCGIRGKELPEYLHLDVTVMLSLIFMATVLIRLNLEGIFWFIHLIGPVLVLIHFFLFCDCRKIERTAFVLTGIVFPLIYIVFASGILKLTGECPFPARLILVWDSPFMPFVMILALCILILVVGFVFLYLNRFICKKRNP